MRKSTFFTPSFSSGKEAWVTAPNQLQAVPFSTRCVSEGLSLRSPGQGTSRPEGAKNEASFSVCTSNKHEKVTYCTAQWLQKGLPKCKTKEKSFVRKIYQSGQRRKEEMQKNLTNVYKKSGGKMGLK